MIALALIVKGDDKEAVVLDRCLSFVFDYVDAIYITITQPNKAVEDICNKYKAHISEFKWCNDFSAARNFNFDQVPKEYEYILWLDADDVLRGADKLKQTLKENPTVDCFALNYLYAFDEYNNPIVVHQKTQIVKNGSVKWVGRVHEDFKPTREIETKFIKGIERLHLSTEDRFENSKLRNLEIAREQAIVEPGDPRSYWNLGNALKAAGLNDESIPAFEKFLETSLSDDEKYIVRLRLAEVYWNKKELNKAIECAQFAIGTKPNYPDAYHLLGSIYYEMKNFLKAQECYLIGLTKKPPYYNIIVYNPRDYDYVPLMNLAKVYFSVSRPDLALICLENCRKIQPEDKSLKKTISLMRKEKNKLDKVLDFVKKTAKMDKEKLRKALDNVPKELQSHPTICNIRNINFVKETSSGKDLVFVCNYTEKEWSPKTALEKGVGGSEEAVIWLAQLLSDRGWNVTVYNNCGHKEKTFGKVKYLPFWTWNYRDKQDVVVLWRHPKMCDYEINAEKVIIDMHDALESSVFTPQRLEKITKVFVKSEFHKSLFPSIPDDKIVVVPNGIDSELFREVEEKDENLMICTSSPDRGLNVLVDLFADVKKQVPEAKLQWAYGWDIFDVVHKENAKIMEWKRNLEEKMQQNGVEVLGRISHGEVAKLYKKAKVFAYPSEFAEIDCISLSKAMAAGAYPVTTDFAAMGEKNFYKDYIHSEKTKDNWCKPYQFDFSMETGKEEWVEKCVQALKQNKDLTEMRNWSLNTYDWNKIADIWNNNL